jgi:four helix bundle protein
LVIWSSGYPVIDCVIERVADVIARQLAKSSTSVAANYRAACTARSKPEFVAKLGIVSLNQTINDQMNRSTTS